MIKIHQGIARRPASSPLIMEEEMTKIKSKNASKFIARKSMNFSTTSPIGNRTFGNSVIDYGLYQKEQSHSPHLFLDRLLCIMNY